METINISAYHWDAALAENLGRNTITQGERLSVLRAGPDSLLAQALAGKTPTVNTPVMLGKPNDDAEIPFIVEGYGRIKSVLAWDAMTPLQRARAAFGLLLETGSPLREADLAALKSVEDVRALDITKASVNGARLTGNPDAIIAACKSDIVVPVVWFEGGVDQARSVAYSDVATDERTVADVYNRYRQLVGAGLSRSALARELKIEPSRVTHYQTFYQAAQPGGVERTEGTDKEARKVQIRLLPAMAKVLEVHMAGRMTPEQPPTASFDTMGGRERLSYKTGTDPVSLEDQAAALELAVRNSRKGASDDDKAKMPTSDDFFRAYQSGGLTESDLVSIAQRIDGRELAKAVEQVKSEREIERLKATVAGRKTLEDRKAAAEAPDTPQAFAPTLRSVQRMFSAERWAQNAIAHPCAEIFAQIGLFIHGHLTAEQLLVETSGIKVANTKANQYRPGSAMVPDTLEAQTDGPTTGPATIKTLAQLRAEAEKEAEKAAEAAKRKKAAESPNNPVADRRKGRKPTSK